MRRTRRIGLERVRAGIAVLAVACAATLATGAAARTTLPLATFADATPTRANLVPRAGQVVPLGSKVEGDCEIEDGGVDGRASFWDISSVIPRFKHGGDGGVELAPTADKLPRFAKGPDPPQGPFKNDWVMVPSIMALAIPGVGCQMQSFDPLGALTMEQPGPHVFTQYYQTVHFQAYTDSSDAPPAQACGRNDPDFPSPNGEVNPPPPLDDATWVVTAFCNTTIVIGFHVASKGDCPANGDMSRWSSVPYINQYDAGRRLDLPESGADGRKGGNACGPSSLMMAMLQGGPGDLTTLPKAYDATMQRTADQVAAAVAAAPSGPPKVRKKALKKARNNAFTGGNAVAFVKSLGWKSAAVRGLGTNVEDMERTILTSMQGRYPVVISTAFGMGQWGVSGGGHMIAIVGADRRGNFIVNDPAGNYFATPRGHYGPGQCGQRAVYPHYWLLAYTTGRWLLELGKRTPPRGRPFATPGTSRPNDARSLFDVLEPGAAKYGTAFSVVDTHPGAKDAPKSFYLQDSSGRRAGWIEGRTVSQIAGASVSQDVPGWTDPAVDESSSDDPNRADPTPRAIVVSELGAGTKLFVSGGRFSLTAKAWQDGKVVKARTLTGTRAGVVSLAGLGR